MQPVPGRPLLPESDFWHSHTLASGVDRNLLERLVQRLIATSASREQLIVRAPFTSQAIGSVPLCTPEDVAATVGRARRAQPGWAEVPFRDRRNILLRFHDLLLDQREQGLDLIQVESGKARRYALEEILDTALVARHYAIRGENYLRVKRHRGAMPVFTRAWEYRHPVGVVGFIAPWN